MARKPWELTREQRIEAKFSDGKAAIVAAELQTFWTSYVNELEQTSKQPGDRWTAVETRLSRKHRVGRSPPPIDYDPMFGSPQVAVLGDTVVVAHDALHSWGLLPAYLVARGGRIHEAPSVLLQVWAQVIFAAPRSEASLALDSWIEHGPGCDPAPWGPIFGGPEDLRIHTFDGGVELAMPATTNSVHAFVQWNADAGHKLELRVATDADLGRSVALRRAIRERLHDLYVWSDATNAMLERLRVARRRLVCAADWPTMNAAQWARRIAAHVERETPETSASTLCAADLATFDPVAVLLSELSSDQIARLDQEVPTEIEIGGVLRKVRYPSPSQGEVDLPLLESLGLGHMPKRAVEFTARLLAPDGHCVAIIADLPYFWRVMYDDWFRRNLIASHPTVDWPPVQPR